VKNTKPGVFRRTPSWYIDAKKAGATMLTMERKFIKLPDTNPFPKPASLPCFMIKASTASLLRPPGAPGINLKIVLKTRGKVKDVSMSLSVPKSGAKVVVQGWKNTEHDEHV